MAEVWYPIEKNKLRPEIVEALWPVRERLENSVTSDQSSLPVDGKKQVPDARGPGKYTENKNKTGWTFEEWFNEHARLIYGASGLILFVAAIVFFAVVLPGIRTKKKQVTGSPPPNRSPGKQPQGQGVEDRDLERLKALIPLICQPLAEAMKEVLAQASTQKITVEVPPPAAYTSDWVSFIRAVKNELERASPGTAGISGQGGQGFDDKGFGRRYPAFETSGPQQDFSLRQIYVERRTGYGDGSASFGGKPVFLATNDWGASFCITVDPDGTGLLGPNPEARTFDAAYHQLFGVSRSEEFPVRRPVSPRRVRLEGDQWVLASNA